MGRIHWQNRIYSLEQPSACPSVHAHLHVSYQLRLVLTTGLGTHRRPRPLAFVPRVEALMAHSLQAPSFHMSQCTSHSKLFLPFPHALRIYFFFPYNRRSFISSPASNLLQLHCRDKSELMRKSKCHRVAIVFYMPIDDVHEISNE